MSLRRMIIATHRDVGYFLAGVIVIYSISGLALNHVDDWNPNFIVERREIAIALPSRQDSITRNDVLRVCKGRLKSAAGGGRKVQHPLPV